MWCWAFRRGKEAARLSSTGSRSAAAPPAAARRYPLDPGVFVLCRPLLMIGLIAAAGQSVGRKGACLASAGTNLRDNVDG